ncbi:tyrosine-type recombinase/integrase [Halalkalibacterium halodurans]|uniref:Integrase n=1 Tax=Halalkalibacterium halodurans TaxID=86665 RepID=A0A0M0KDM5_ALKHA|nr:tyrosine-type recombinase/integrase [Halalkalibacterium halodurans]MED3646618.1 tyrosine-type recombinase/integrase [Halalkalibacterium halodurans]MED4164247.1 tyrosine-type recombinase/integrase [Halalkalibacterium halodurans]TES44796.1 site-specific integrase [Halalkalibacterium halodurans]TPE68239.1 site-specific integrase [Halalkalibacterium halodurans]
MEYVEPFRDVDQIQAIKRSLKKKSPRDYLLFTIGINTGLRISQLLALKIKDVYDGQKPKDYLQLESGEIVYLNDQVKKALQFYAHFIEFQEQHCLFASTNPDQPMTRQHAYRIIKQAALQVGLTDQIGTHTLRKTFGYHAYRQGVALSLLQQRFNHQTPAQTLRYIGIAKNEQTIPRINVNL